MTRARDVADTQDNVGGAVAPFVAGKNKIINGDFGIWQRGTSFPGNSYTADRFRCNGNGTGVTQTISRQSFTLGTAPVAGYESAYFYRYAQTAAGSGSTFQNILIQPIEDVRTFAGQTITISFWAKADSAKTLTVVYGQEFANSGVGDQYPTLGTVSVTTSWARYSVTGTIDSIAGKTIGSGGNANFQVIIQAPFNVVQTIDLWGIQAEAGRVATPFTTASGSIGGELALCQRYYQRFGGDVLYSIIGFGNARSTQITDASVPFNVAMRIAPTSVDFSTLATIPNYGTGTVTSISALSINSGGNSRFSGQVVATSSGTPFTQNNPYYLSTNNSTSGFLAFNAEL